MTKTVVFLIVGILVLGCSKEKASKPANLIPQDQMEEILYDLNIFQAVRNTNYALYQTANLNPEQYIYKKYNIDSVQFAQSHKYYIADIEQYEKMLDRLLKRIEQERQQQIASDSLSLPQTENDSLTPQRKRSVLQPK